MSHPELFARHLENVGSASPNLEIYAADIVAEFPYAPEGHTNRLEGTAALGRFLAAIGTFALDYTRTETTFHETPNGVVAEYGATAVFKDTGLRYTQQYIVVAEMADGKITRLREFYNPIRVLEALGEFPA